MRPQSVLITDGDQRAALAVVRSLAAAGWRCVVGSAHGRSLAGCSRFTDLQVVLPNASASPVDYSNEVSDLVKKHAIDVVIPIAEPSMLAILAARKSISAAIPFPELQAFEAVCDKQALLRVATELGIRVPRQIEIERPQDATELQLQPPYVLKPHRSVCTTPDGSRLKLGVAWAHSHQEVRAVLNGYPLAAFPILVQEAVVGPGIGIFLLLDDRGGVISFAHRRIREKPPSGGVSVLRQSEPMNEVLLEKSIALMHRYGWTGVAMVEYKIDTATGDPVLMEVNGRFWGSLQLAIDAGIDFPRLLLERNAERPSHYRFVRSRWFWGDVDHVVGVWRNGSSLTERAMALAGLVRACGPGFQEEVFRWSDPGPFMYETGLWFRELFR